MPFKRTDEVPTNTIGEGRPDFTGLTQLVKTVGTVTQKNILGTLTQITKIEDIGNLGTVVQLDKIERPIDSGTVMSATLGGSGTIGPQNINGKLTRQVTLGFNTDTAMNIAHELKIGDQWVRNGASSVPVEGHITTISHNFDEWRGVRTDGNADANVTVTYEGRN